MSMNNMEIPTTAGSSDTKESDSQEVGNAEGDVQSHDIEANDDLVRSVIVDQTDNLEKGWREALQNIIDSEATIGELVYTPEWTFVEDNGNGVELNEQAGINLLTNMGESSKDDDDHDTIGRFGIGKGQIIAKGRTAFVSGNQALLFDIKDWGLEAKQVDVSQLSEYASRFDDEWADLLEEKFSTVTDYDGLAILVDHYEDEVPDDGSYKWDRYETDLKKRFQYLEWAKDTELRFNGQVISDDEPESAVKGCTDRHVETFTGDGTGSVRIAVTHNNTGSLDVYSGGIHVKEVENRGLSGVVVTKRNLRLNFARNEIKSGCPIWNEVEARLDEIRTDMFSEVNEDSRLNDSARKFIAKKMFSDSIEDYDDMEVFQTATENTVSFNEITDRDEIGTSKVGNPAADKLEEMGKLVLDKEDDATAEFLDNRDGLEEEYDIPDDFDATDRAESEGLHTQFDIVPEDDLNSKQKRYLGIARLMAEEMDLRREVEYGESDVANAWTDGVSFVAITDGAAGDGGWEAWVPKLFDILVHEAAHTGSDKEEADHGISFNRRYRKKKEKYDAARATAIEEIKDKGVTEVAQQHLDTDI